MLHEKINHSTGRTIGILGAFILAGIVIAGRVHGAEVTVEKQVSVSNIRAQQERLNLITHSALIARGQTLGEVVIFDNPATRRSADYLEVYDITKRLVAIVWFDSFGIQRTVIDRALVDGGRKLEGVLVSILEGEPV
jgi:hypothetical protein